MTPAAPQGYARGPGIYQPPAWKKLSFQPSFKQLFPYGGFETRLEGSGMR